MAGFEAKLVMGASDPFTDRLLIDANNSTVRTFHDAAPFSIGGILGMFWMLILNYLNRHGGRQ